MSYDNVVGFKNDLGGMKKNAANKKEKARNRPPGSDKLCVKCAKN